MSADAGRLRLNDALRVTSVGLRARPLRAALSALGIAIGTAAIVAVLGLSSSSQAGLLAEIDRLGTNMLTLEAGQSVTGREAQLPREAPGRIITAMPRTRPRLAILEPMTLPSASRPCPPSAAWMPTIISGADVP